MQSLSQLPPYQSDIVRSVTREVRDLDRDVTEMLEPFNGHFDPAEEPATACSLLVRHLCMRRNKRCLLAYHRVRVEMIEGMCWSGSDLLEQVQASQNKVAEEGARIGSVEGSGASSLSPEEEEYARQYGDLLAAYKGQWTDIDLTGSLEPPRDLFIDVRVLKDAGEIQTEYGWGAVVLFSNENRTNGDTSAITLTKNSQFFVRQGDVERLIAQGFLQKLN